MKVEIPRIRVIVRTEEEWRSIHRALELILPDDWEGFSAWTDGPDPDQRIEGFYQLEEFLGELPDVPYEKVTKG